jgi:hypothetical protein
MKPKEHWRVKMRNAVEAEADAILGVVGLIAAIHAWREEQLEAQREYIRIELQGMMARQSKAMNITQGWLDEFQGLCAQAHVDMMITKVEAQGVAGLIAAICAWREWLLARELVRTHRACVHCMDGRGRYVGEIESLPSCIAYGATEDEARDNARLYAVQIIRDRLTR